MMTRAGHNSESNLNIEDIIFNISDISENDMSSLKDSSMCDLSDATFPSSVKGQLVVNLEMSERVCYRGRRR